MKKKLCEIIYCVKNDNYHDDLIEKINFALNYNLQQIEKVNLLNYFSFTFVDWGSQKKISESLSPSCYTNNVNYYYLSDEFLQNNNLNENHLYTSQGLNLAIRRSDARFIIIGSCDIIITSNNWKKIYDYLSSECSNLFYVERKFIPDTYYDFQNISFLNYILENNFFFRENLINFGGQGLIGASYEKWIELNGLNEKFIGYGHSDIEIAIRASVYVLPDNITDKFGVISYKLPYSASGERKKIVKNSKNYSYLWKNLNKRDGDWGFKNSNIKKYKIKKYSSTPNNFKKKPIYFPGHKLIFLVIYYFSKKDNLFNLVKLWKYTSRIKRNIIYLDGNFTLLEYLIFSCIFNVSIIFITNNDPLDASEFYLKCGSLNKFGVDSFSGKIFIDNKNTQSQNFHFIDLTLSEKVLYLKKNDVGYYSSFTNLGNKEFTNLKKQKFLSLVNNNLFLIIINSSLMHISSFLRFLYRKI